VVGLVVASALVLPSPPSQAEPATCQGKEATIVGPTAPGAAYRTVGTEGDDVIVAPLAPDGEVQGLGGDDTICLVGGGAPDPTLLGARVEAGDGDDSVLNLAVSSLHPIVSLGAGSDHYVGNDFSESVTTGTYGGLDEDVDVVESFGGDDHISSGLIPEVENHDLISTGAGHDIVNYGNPSGERVDNGTGADTLSVDPATPQAWLIDNDGGRLSVGDQTMLTWTNVDTFRTREVKGSSFTFRGTDGDETFIVDGDELGATSPPSPATFRGGSISMGGGNDSVELANYLPGEVDMGSGTDAVEYQVEGACSRASITMDGSADCTTLWTQETVVTRLAGIESLDARTRDQLVVFGTPRSDVINARSRVLRVHSGAGHDRVQTDQSRDVTVRGGRGNDTLTGSSCAGRHCFERFVSLVLRGGQGDDRLIGANTPDRLYGGPGRDRADGQSGRDICVAEVRRKCEPAALSR